MKCTDGLFQQLALEVAKGFPQVAFEHILVDNLCMQLVMRPAQFDVLVLPNLYGDIVSDLCAGLIGGLGVAPGANIGKDCAVFEATHGSAPKYKGMNKVNPTALILSAVMMLDYLGQKNAARRLEQAVALTIARGEKVTYDLLPPGQAGRAAGTQEMAEAIIANLAA